MLQIEFNSAVVALSTPRWRTIYLSLLFRFDFLITKYMFGQS